MTCFGLPNELVLYYTFSWRAVNFVRSVGRRLRRKTSLRRARVCNYNSQFGRTRGSQPFFNLRLWSDAFENAEKTKRIIISQIYAIWPKLKYLHTMYGNLNKRFMFRMVYSRIFVNSNKFISLLRRFFPPFFTSFLFVIHYIQFDEICKLILCII